MNFEEFCNEVAENIYNYLPKYDIEAVRIDKITKNNGVDYTGVIILLKDEYVAPNIYLDYYYMVYKQGKTLDDVLRMISEEYKVARGTMMKTDFDVCLDRLKENAIIKLVNYERNRSELEECPYIRYLDLAITFRFLVKLDDGGMASALVRNKDIAGWGINKEELYELALANTIRLFPARFRGMEEIIPDIETLCSEEDRRKLFVLTNNAGINGATSILYENVIRDFARDMGKSLFIMPSSVHEMVLICCDSAEKESLKKLVKEVNKFIVSEVEFLSDNVYFYDLDTDKITI